jgi:hypothetical protein
VPANRRITTAGSRGLVVSFVLVVTGCLFTTVAYAAFTGHDLDGDRDGAPNSGHVSLRVNTSSTTTCHIADLVPGDSPTPTPCRFSISYTGSVAAYVALDVMVDSTTSSSGHTLYDSGRSDGLTFVISDGHRTFATPTAPGSTGGACPRGLTCWNVGNELAAWYDASGAHVVFTASVPAVTWTETAVIPRSLSNEFQGASANLVLTAQAIQAVANPLPSNCSTQTIGRACASTNHFTWN